MNKLILRQNIIKRNCKKSEINMKIDCVLTAVNDNILYTDFIPLFVKTWNKLYPNIDVKIILISNSIPERFLNYKKNIILFKPLKGISSGFISQYIRLLYPGLLDYKNGVLITDIDMLPMNRTYFSKNIENISNNKFISMRKAFKGQVPICYCIAIKRTWRKVFKISSVKDVIERLNEVYKDIEYKNNVYNEAWSKDQFDLFKHLNEYQKRTNDVVTLSDTNTGFNRLDRNKFDLDKNTVEKIKNGFYTDYHCYRPMYKYWRLNNKIFEIL